MLEILRGQNKRFDESLSVLPRTANS